MVVTKPLTAVAIRALKPQPQPYEVSDGGCTGLRVVIFPTGAKSFIHRFRREGVPKKATLGSADSLTLAEARRQVAAARARLERDIDPAPVQPALHGGDDIPTAVAQFLALHVRRKNRPATVQGSRADVQVRRAPGLAQPLGSICPSFSTPRRRPGGREKTRSRSC
jgi:Arm DNA-binding domain